MDLHDVAIRSLDGQPGTLRSLTGGCPAMVVNVASKCGLTPQYAELQELHQEFAGSGFRVVGVPCNQFAEEEPGSPEDIAEFCSTTYGVTFPLTEKVRVNGKRRHPLYAALARVQDADGYSGEVRWNFEKFLIDGDGQAVARFEPGVSPADWRIMESISGLLSR